MKRLIPFNLRRESVLPRLLHYQCPDCKVNYPEKHFEVRKQSSGIWICENCGEKFYEEE